jgi:hypothetical protein
MIAVLQLAKGKKAVELVVSNQGSFNTIHCAPLLATEGFAPGHALQRQPVADNTTIISIFFRYAQWLYIRELGFRCVF